MNRRPCFVACLESEAGYLRCLDLLGLDQVLDLSNGRDEDLALELLVGDALLDVGEHGVDELLLLGLTGLSLVADPRVEDRLDVGRDRSLLLEDKGLVLELGSLLWAQISAWCV